MVDLTNLGLPLKWQKEIAKIIMDNRMLYEPLMETAKDFMELKKRLKHKGYTNLPMGSPQMINFLEFGMPPALNTNGMKPKKTMLQKRKK